MDQEEGTQEAQEGTKQPRHEEPLRPSEALEAGLAERNGLPFTGLACNCCCSGACM